MMKDFFGLLITIFFVFLFLGWLLRLLLPYILKFLLGRFQKRIMKQFQQPQYEADFQQQKPLRNTSKEKKPVGEYIDFEELD